MINLSSNHRVLSTNQSITPTGSGPITRSRPETRGKPKNVSQVWDFLPANWPVAAKNPSKQGFPHPQMRAGHPTTGQLKIFSLHIGEETVKLPCCVPQSYANYYDQVFSVGSFLLFPPLSVLALKHSPFPFFKASSLKKSSEELKSLHTVMWLILIEYCLDCVLCNFFSFGLA